MSLQAIRQLGSPSVAEALARDLLFKRPYRALAPERHLSATMAWLCRAQDVAGSRGVSAGYSLARGWLAPYPETTGYIIPTFFDYAHLTGDEEYFARALRMADWEMVVQLPNGGIQAGLFVGQTNDRIAAPFNTGQVIHGWCRAFKETGHERYLDAATRAADWLGAIQSADGAWRTAAPQTDTTLHAYDARTAWSLLDLGRLTGRGAYIDDGSRHLSWVLSQQTANGWFLSNAFFPPEHRWGVTFTHTIAYVLEGLLGAWDLTREPAYLKAATATADVLAAIYDGRGLLPGDFAHDWTTFATYRCLTGDAQVAAVWFSLWSITAQEHYRRLALSLNALVKQTQTITATHPGIRGGIKGSHPINGRYTPYTYPNWAAKFFADALMLELRSPMPSAEVDTSATRG